MSPRIRTLLLARNRISAIQATLPNAIPNLKNLVLTSNNLTELSDIDVLGKFAQLTHLVLMDNPVTKREVRLDMPMLGKTSSRSVLIFPQDCGLTLIQALPILGPMAMSYRTVPGLPKGQGRGEGEGEGAVRDS